MTFQTEIVDYLEANTALSDIWIGEIERNTAGVYVVFDQGGTPDFYTGVEEYEADFWALTRNTSDGYENLGIIYDFFHQRAHYDTVSYHIYFTNAQGQIADMDRDAEGNKLLRLRIRWVAGITVS